MQAVQADVVEVNPEVPLPLPVPAPAPIAPQPELDAGVMKQYIVRARRYLADGTPVIRLQKVNRVVYGNKPGPQPYQAAPEQTARILALNANKTPITEIAKQLGISAYHIKKILNK